jgi:DNA polymerase I-like protein with 3'-5' exonuclease and polymerase domains
VSQLPLFTPATDWRVPNRLPDIPHGLDICIDLETKDDGLNQGLGPGWAFGLGYVLGVGVGWRQDGQLQAVYLPLRHPDTANLDPSTVYRWVTDLLRNCKSVVFHNAPYDLGWLWAEGVVWDEDHKVEDTHAMAVMLDENRRSYSLDNVCADYGIPGKDKELMNNALAVYGGKGVADLWKIPARFAGEYAEGDVIATLQLLEILSPLLDQQGVRGAYRLEADLLPITTRMRKRGVRIDVSKTEQLIRQLRVDRDNALRAIGSRVDMKLINSSRHLQVLFDEHGAPYPAGGGFSKDWMEKADHWLPQAIVKARFLNDMSEKFLGTYILGYSNRGRIHAEINQLRDDEKGTRTYRLSYSNPPLQQMPARGDASKAAIAAMIRGAFLPEDGDVWCAGDYSQQEPRLAVHFAAMANIDGAIAAVEYYAKELLTGEKADFHDMVSEITGLVRDDAKIINLGIMYGMGLAKLANDLKKTLEEAEAILETYHLRMPWMKALQGLAKSRAMEHGAIRLIDGALSRFNMYEPAAYGMAGGLPLPHAAALKRWPGQRLRRAFGHKALNRLVQGSAARQTKLAMRAAAREGYLPLLQMHDELDFTVQTDKQVSRIKEIMETVVTLKVPVMADMELGYTWGHSMVKPKASSLAALASKPRPA